MSDILSAISDDIDSYVALCKRFNEEPERDKSGLDPYGDHAKKIEVDFRVFASLRKVQ